MSTAALQPTEVAWICGTVSFANGTAAALQQIINSYEFHTIPALPWPQPPRVPWQDEEEGVFYDEESAFVHTTIGLGTFVGDRQLMTPW